MGKTGVIDFVLRNATGIAFGAVMYLNDLSITSWKFWASLGIMTIAWAVENNMARRRA